MAWNDIPAKDDPNLSFQAYYARPNVLQSMMKSVSGSIFREMWAVAESGDFAGLLKASLVGNVVGDLIRALGLGEISESHVSVGDWFTHSGVTFYSPRDRHSDNATIKLPDGRRITGVVRHECRITNSASVNMAEEDDISFVVGRVTANDKFDLVAAGYRDPMASLTGERDLQIGPVRDLSLMTGGKVWSENFISKIKLNTSDTEALALVIKDTVTRFSVAVGTQGAWRLLYGKDGHPLHETQHQGMFRLFSQLPFGAMGVRIEPNADHGSGPTDFTLRLNDSVNILEFKKDDKKEEMRHGLAVQLPNYMVSAGAQRGTYVVMCHSRKKEEVYDLLGQVLASDPTLPPIDCYVIDCSPKISASKAKSRYSVD
jgi:hypothetical protein